MTIRGAAFLVTLAAIATPMAAAEACRCVQRTPATSYKQAAAVMLGTVSEARDVSPYDRSYRIAVERSWKRSLKGTVAIHSTRSACLAELTPGEKYLIYVVRDTMGRWRTSACLGNRPAADAGSTLAWLAARR